MISTEFVFLFRVLQRVAALLRGGAQTLLKLSDLAHDDLMPLAARPAIMREGAQHTALLRVDARAEAFQCLCDGCGRRGKILFCMTNVVRKFSRQFLELLMEARNVRDGIDAVKAEADEQNRGGNVPRDERDRIDERRDQRMHDKHDHNGERTEDDRADQTHAPFDVELAARIVPPARMKQFFHRPARKILQRAVHESAREKQQDRVFDRPQKQKIEHCAEPVDRAVRAVQKTAVDESLLCNGAQRRLVAPAGNAVNHKIKEPCFDRLHFLS